MAGHSKWANIKRKKGVNDAKRGKLFTKLIREIQVAAGIGGGDPNGNPRLRDAMTEARKNSVPRDTIERAIARGAGQGQGERFEEITYEGYGPGGTAMLIHSLTDNRNRTVADIRAVLVRNGGSLGETGSVGWMFDKKGLISVLKTKAAEDQVMNVALESGADDIVDQGEAWEVLTSPASYESVRGALPLAGIDYESAAITMVPKNYVSLAGEGAQQMFELIEALEDLDDVQKITANFEVDDSEMQKLGLLT